MPTFATAAFGTFLASLGAVWFWRWFARRLGCLDIPNERSSHQGQVPRSGGVAFACVFLLVAAELMPADATLAGWLSFLLPAALLAITGLADDLRGLGIAPRLVLQALTLVLALYFLPQVPELVLPGGLVLGGTPFLVLLFVFWLWFINLYNFMDGLDALAASEALFAALALALLAGSGGEWGLCQLALLLALCVGGFLPFNLPRASIFMGDAGSNFLGYVLIALSVAGMVLGVLTVWTVLILFAVFIVDASFTLLRRMLGGELWYHGHRSHAYQRAADLLASHGKVVLATAVINVCWLLPLAWLSVRFEQAGLLLVLVAWAPLLWLSVRLAPGRREGAVQTRKSTP